jgi:orotidine-5'-phosphate decarboxylase
LEAGEDEIMNTDIIVALDFPNAGAALKLVDQLGGVVRNYKIGKELFVAEGPSVVRQIRERGFDVFLDLKFHDIPNTVSRACLEAARLDVRWCTLHASGGSDMMRAASDAVRSSKEGRRPYLLAVTVLTSLDDGALKEIGVDHTAAGQVLHLARLAKKSGMDGVVASVQEAQMIREELGAGFLIVTPGVRPASDTANDQKRTATPREAAQAGADYIVVGRPIAAASNPREAALRIRAELQ